MHVRPFVVRLLCAFLLLTGGGISAAEQPPVVRVGLPVERMVTDHEDFTGRLDAATRVEIRPRVSGYLATVRFKNGAAVKRGDLLFEIDPRSYQARYDEAMSQVALSEASLKLARMTYERDLEVSAKAPGAISQRQLDQDKAALEEATARVLAYKASAEIHKLNLVYTKLVAPMDGFISGRLLDPGNLVTADTTLLATLVSRDPIHVFFDVDERTVLRMRRAVREDKPKEGSAWSVTVGLADEKGFPRTGTMDLADLALNAETGTLRLRAVFTNDDGLLLPGLFCRVRLAIGGPYKALLVPARAVAPDAGQTILAVVNQKNEVEYRRVNVGPRQEDDLRVVREGLKPGEWVVLAGLKGLRPGMVVKPEVVAVPVKEPPAEENRP